MLLFAALADGNILIHHLAAHRAKPHRGVGSCVIEVGARVRLHRYALLPLIPGDSSSVFLAGSEFGFIRRKRPRRGGLSDAYIKSDPGMVKEATDAIERYYCPPPTEDTG